MWQNGVDVILSKLHNFFSFVLFFFNLLNFILKYFILLQSLWLHNFSIETCTIVPSTTLGGSNVRFVIQTNSDVTVTEHP